MMANYKKMDDQDFIFVNESPSAKEDKEFSEYLKNRKPKTKAKWICTLWKENPNKIFPFGNIFTFA